MQKFKDSKVLVIGGETYQGEYSPKGSELEELTRDTGLTRAQVRSSANSNCSPWTRLDYSGQQQ